MKITTSQLRAIIKEEYEAAVEDGAMDTEAGEEVLNEEQNQWVEKIVGYVKKLGAKFGPEFIAMVGEKLTAMAEDAASSFDDAAEM